MLDLVATRDNGNEIINTTLRNGRLFLIEDEPILDSFIASPGRIQLVLYGQPGSQCIIETRTSFSNDDSWEETTGLTLTNTWFTHNWLIESNAPTYFRLRKLN
jgi:hypothetical protein